MKLMEITARLDKSSVHNDGNFPTVEYFILLDLGKADFTVEEFFAPVNEALGGERWSGLMVKQEK